MRLNRKLTKERVRNHLTYDLWKYLLLGVGTIFFWSLIYDQTAYRSPQEKRIDVMIVSNTVTDELMQAFFEPIWKETVPDMELVEGVTLLSGSSGGNMEQDYYSAINLSVKIAAAEGDIYLLPKAEFKSYASGGAFVPLEELVEQGLLNIDGLDVSAGWMTVMDEETGIAESHLYGIPTDQLYGLMDGLQYDNRGAVMTIAVNNQNEDNVALFFNALVQAGRGDPPEWLENTAN